MARIQGSEDFTANWARYRSSCARSKCDREDKVLTIIAQIGRYASLLRPDMKPKQLSR